MLRSERNGRCMMTSSNGNIFRVTGPLSPVNFPHKGQWRGALMFSLICAWINAWVNNREAGDLRRYRAHCDVTVMDLCCNENFQIRFCDRKFCHIDGNITEDYYRLPNNLILVMAYSFLHSTQWIFYKILEVVHVFCQPIPALAYRNVIGFWGVYHFSGGLWRLASA